MKTPFPFFALFTALFASLVFVAVAPAQPPWGRGGDDDRGGFRGRGGGPPGGGFGDRGSRRGGRGGFGDRGGRGGPPGGGFGGRGRGGDPSEFVKRLDRNDNGVIDPDEQQGPAQFLISRLQAQDSSIKPGQPIPLSKLSEGFEKMREGRGRGGGDRGVDPREAAREALEVELLVPGFGSDFAPEPVGGFGPAAEMWAVRTTEEDEERAARTIRRYDRNRNGQLDGREMRRLSGNPLDFDRNGDENLSPQELAVHYARQRVAEEEAREQNRGDDRGDRPEEHRESDAPDPYNGRNSFRVVSIRELPEGVPGWFEDKDADGDGQVAMAEYADKWSNDLVEEFMAWDANGDGMVTVDEVLRGVESGLSSTAASSRGSSARGSDRASVRASDDEPRVSSSGDRSPNGDAPQETVEPDDKLIQYAETIIDRYDENEDGELTASEWESMLLNPAPADSDRDGRISVKEYATYLATQRARD